MKRTTDPKSPESGQDIFLVALLLIIAALLSAVALDFISRGRGEKSYLFPIKKREAEILPPARTLSGILSEGLTAAGAPAASVEGRRDPQGRFKLEVRIPLALYEETHTFLERWLSGEGVEILDRRREEGEGRVEVYWLARSQDGTEATILFICPVPPPPEAPAKKPAGKKPGTGRVALIMDDMGNSLEVLNDLLGLGESLTIAILPFSTFARETAEIAHANGLEVLLHLPLESQNNHNSSYSMEGLILADMAEPEIRRILAADLEGIPFAQGVNNHMGSRFTATAPVMKTVLGFLKERNLFFVDSRTTAQSVAYAEAVRMGVPAAARDVFLDADEDRAMIRSRLVELFRTAQNRGKAVGIGHPFPETIKVLKEDFGLLGEYNLEAVPVSRLFDK